MNDSNWLIFVFIVTFLCIKNINVMAMEPDKDAGAFFVPVLFLLPFWHVTSTKMSEDQAAGEAASEEWVS